jgi:DNA-binding transcriptional LysR family regulator
MEEKDWQLLQILHEKQNITKTAESLFISQPALTYRIQQLEKEFDVTILHRGRRGIEFTPQGEYLVKYTYEMISQLHSIKEQLLSMSNKISGTLKIGSARSFCHYRLPKILKQFNLLYPDSEFKVVTKWSSELVNMVFKQDLHIGFIRGDLDWAGEKQLLMAENICVVSSKEINLMDLPKLPRIVYKTEASLESTIDNWWKETFVKPPLITMEVDRMETCREMILNGLGYGILPSLVLNNDESLYSLQLKTKFGEPLFRKSWIIYRTESLQIPLIREFVNFVKENYSY